MATASKSRRVHKPTGFVYVLHFTQPVGHARHYVGFTSKDDVSERLAYHRAGRGSRLIKALIEQGGDFELVKVWKHASRNFERRLKEGGSGARVCPCCTAKPRFPGKVAPETLRSYGSRRDRKPTLSWRTPSNRERIAAATDSGAEIPF